MSGTMRGSRTRVKDMKRKGLSTTSLPSTVTFGVTLPASKVKAKAARNIDSPCGEDSHPGGTPPPGFSAAHTAARGVAKERLQRAISPKEAKEGYACCSPHEGLGTPSGDELPRYSSQEDRLLEFLVRQDEHEGNNPLFMSLTTHRKSPGTQSPSELVTLGGDSGLAGSSSLGARGRESVETTTSCSTVATAIRAEESPVSMTPKLTAHQPAAYPSTASSHHPAAVHHSSTPVSVMLGTSRDSAAAAATAAAASSSGPGSGSAGVCDDGNSPSPSSSSSSSSAAAPCAAAAAAPPADRQLRSTASAPAAAAAAVTAAAAAALACAAAEVRPVSARKTLGAEPGYVTGVAGFATALPKASRGTKPTVASTSSVSFHPVLNPHATIVVPMSGRSQTATPPSVAPSKASKKSLKQKQGASATLGRAQAVPCRGCKTQLPKKKRNAASASSSSPSAAVPPVPHIAQYAIPQGPLPGAEGPHRGSPVPSILIPAQLAPASHSSQQVRFSSVQSGATSSSDGHVRSSFTLPGSDSPHRDDLQEDSRGVSAFASSESASASGLSLQHGVGPPSQRSESEDSAARKQIGDILQSLQGKLQGREDYQDITDRIMNVFRASRPAPVYHDPLNPDGSPPPVAYAPPPSYEGSVAGFPPAHSGYGPPQGNPYYSFPAQYAHYAPAYGPPQIDPSVASSGQPVAREVCFATCVVRAFRAPRLPTARAPALLPTSEARLR